MLQTGVTFVILRLRSEQLWGLKTIEETLPLSGS